MKLGRILAIGIGIALFSVLVPGQPGRCEAQGLRFAQVSLPKVYRESKRLKQIVEEATELRNNTQAKMSILAKDIQDLRNKLKAGNLKPDEKQKLEKDLQEKTERLRSEQTQLQMKIAFKQKSVQNVLQTQIPEVLEEVAKKQGLSVIFWDRSLAYASGIPDVSKQVAEVLDTKPAVEKGPVQGPVPTKK